MPNAPPKEKDTALLGKNQYGFDELDIPQPEASGAEQNDHRTGILDRTFIGRIGIRQGPAPKANGQIAHSVIVEATAGQSLPEALSF